MIYILAISKQTEPTMKIRTQIVFVRLAPEVVRVVQVLIALQFAAPIFLQTLF